MQLQESCYLKLVRNVSAFEQHMKKLGEIMPLRGNISVLPMNLNDFKGMKCLLGEPFNMSLFTDDIVCIGEEE